MATGITLSSVAPNVRVRDEDGFVGTVRYIGPVASAKISTEIYAGIEWDDDTRGLHDGSVVCRTTNHIVRHFSTSSPTGGSFVRLRKLKLGLVLDDTLLEQRYVKPEAELVAPENLLPHYASTCSGRGKPIEFYGELKLRYRQQLPDLDRISLRFLGISRAPYSTLPKQKCIHIKEVDLSGNLFSDWAEVGSVLQQFYNLESASLSGNKIAGVPQNHSVWRTNTFSKIKELNLNNCGIQSFATVEVLAKALPNLQELCIANNKLADIGEIFSKHAEHDMRRNYKIHPRFYFKNLKLLDLSHCGITSWNEQVLPLRALPLEHLILNKNPIKTVSIPLIESDKTVCFEKLNAIQIAECEIQCWSSIDHLRFLPSLLSLRFQHNPVTSNYGTAEARSITIARLSQITNLNASVITAKERVQAEKNYIKTVAKEILLTGCLRDCNHFTEQRHTNSGNNTLNMHLFHPRFGELLAKYGESLATIQPMKCIGAKIADDTINLSIRSMAASSCTMEPLNKRLPVSLTVVRLKFMCFKAFNLEISRQLLHLKVVDNPVPIPLDDDDRALSFYGVHDGSEILMSDVNDGAL